MRVGALLGESLRDQLGVRQDDGEQVVEVVGNPAGELADRFHLLGLAQLLLEDITERPESRTRMRPPSFRFHATSAPRIASPLSNRARMRSRSLESAYTSRAMSRASSSASVSYPSSLTSAGFAARNLPSGVDL